MTVFTVTACSVSSTLLNIMNTAYTSMCGAARRASVLLTKDRLYKHLYKHSSSKWCLFKNENGYFTQTVRVFHSSVPVNRQGERLCPSSSKPVLPLKNLCIIQAAKLEVNWPCSSTIGKASTSVCTNYFCVCKPFFSFLSEINPLTLLLSYNSVTF